MDAERNLVCPVCGKPLKYYDSVPRIVRTKARQSRQVRIQRFRCPHCRGIHRNLPDYIFPYKQYEAEIILGVLEGFITCETLGFEDYPCEMTMLRWKSSQKLQMLL